MFHLLPLRERQVSFPLGACLSLAGLSGLCCTKALLTPAKLYVSFGKDKTVQGQRTYTLLLPAHCPEEEH